MQGPSISVDTPYVHAVGAASVKVPVKLSGPNMLPVSANVSISQRIISQGEIFWDVKCPKYPIPSYVLTCKTPLQFLYWSGRAQSTRVIHSLP